MCSGARDCVGGEVVLIGGSICGEIVVGMGAVERKSRRRRRRRRRRVVA